MTDFRGFTNVPLCKSCEIANTVGSGLETVGHTIREAAGQDSDKRTDARNRILLWVVMVTIFLVLPFISVVCLGNR